LILALNYNSQVIFRLSKKLDILFSSIDSLFFLSALVGGMKWNRNRAVDQRLETRPLARQIAHNFYSSERGQPAKSAPNLPKTTANGMDVDVDIAGGYVAI